MLMVSMQTMKRVLLFILLGCGLSLQAQNERFSLSGRIVDPDGTAVSYVTILLKSVADSTKVYGESSDDQGRFLLEVPAGNYSLRTSFLGYNSLNQQIALTSSLDLGDVVIEPVWTELDGVVVQAKMIEREADRFIVNVGNSPLAAGQTAKEMLDLSPTVWIDERRGISINGKENVQVYVNDRLVRESGEALIQYLYSIRAEDIQRI